MVDKLCKPVSVCCPYTDLGNAKLIMDQEIEGLNPIQGMAVRSQIICINVQNKTTITHFCLTKWLKLEATSSVFI